MRQQTKDLIQSDFSENQWELVEQELLSIEEKHTMNGEYNLFNTRMAVLILAKGDIEQVKIQVEQSKIDFRDVVMSAMYTK